MDSVRSLVQPTPAGECFSVAVCADGSYGIDEGLICSFPIRTDGQKWEIIQGVALNEFSQAKVTASVNELKEERAIVSELLPKA